MRFILFCFLALLSRAQAQPSGPIVRSLGNNYYLVQCNAVKLAADDNVMIVRQGHNVGLAKVMRSDSSMCSILLTNGQASHLDLVVLLQRNTLPGDRGPGLPTTLPAQTTPPKGHHPKAEPPKGYFNTINATGTVYNLNTGEYLNKP